MFKSFFIYYKKNQAILSVHVVKLGIKVQNSIKHLYLLELNEFAKHLTKTKIAIVSLNKSI